jgi:hypothetical protein
VSKILPAAVLTAFAVSAASGCSSSSSTTATITGTEAMRGQATGAAAVSGQNGPTVPLTLTGPLNTTSSFTPPNSDATHVTVTFKTPAGNMVVAAVAPDAGQNPVPNPTTCLMTQTTDATYVVVPAKSTGKFAGATGSGKATFYFTAFAPKLADGKCDTSDSAQPLAKGAIVTFTASGPLTVKP